MTLSQGFQSCVGQGVQIGSGKKLLHFGCRLRSLPDFHLQFSLPQRWSFAAVVPVRYSMRHGRITQRSAASWLGALAATYFYAYTLM